MTDERNAVDRVLRPLRVELAVARRRCDSSRTATAGTGNAFDLPPTRNGRASGQNVGGDESSRAVPPR
jgi:hypothetical protein